MKNPFCFSALKLATGKKFRNLRRKIATLADHRLRGITDVISGIRVVKMNAWETCLERKIGETRRYRELIECNKEVKKKMLRKGY